jgi:flagellar basal body-associated protein FliL
LKPELWGPALVEEKKYQGENECDKRNNNNIIIIIIIILIIIIIIVGTEAHFCSSLIGLRSLP